MTFYFNLIVVEQHPPENARVACTVKKSQDFVYFFSELICIFHPSFHLKGFTRYVRKLHSTVNIKTCDKFIEKSLIVDELKKCESIKKIRTDLTGKFDIFW